MAEAWKTWMPLYFGDYLKDTKDLTLEEHGAYLLLMAEYWQHGQIPPTKQRCYKACAAITDSEKTAVDTILSEYFPDGKNGRLDEEILLAQERYERRAGAARKRWDKADAMHNAKHHPKHDAMHMQSQSQSHTKPIVKVHSHAPLFEQAWEMYPKRHGSNPRRDAERAWNARMKEGIDPSDIIAGLQRYIDFCISTGKVGTELVMRASTFFGPSQNWTQEYGAKKTDDMDGLWNEMMEAVTAGGRQTWPEFSDPRIMPAVEAIAGSWFDLCGMSLEKIKAMKGQFINAVRRK